LASKNQRRLLVLQIKNYAAGGSGNDGKKKHYFLRKLKMEGKKKKVKVTVTGLSCNQAATVNEVSLSAC
jgi:hypothetical protein